MATPPLNHWKERGAVPVLATMKVAVSPKASDWATGATVMLGATCVRPSYPPPHPNMINKPKVKARGFKTPGIVPCA